MIVQEIPIRYYEDVLFLEHLLFGDEALNRIGLFQHLRIFSDTSLIVLQNNRIAGYILGLVKSTGEAWVTALGVHPVALSKKRISALLAIELQRRMIQLNMKVGYATTKRQSIIELSRQFGGQVTQTIENYFLDGRPRYIIEFRPPTG